MVLLVFILSDALFFTEVLNDTLLLSNFIESLRSVVEFINLEACIGINDIDIISVLEILLEAALNSHLGVVVKGHVLSHQAVV